MGGDLETGYDWCYCKPYVHITKRLSGTNTCTYQEWVTWTMCDHKFGKTYRRPKPNTNCLGSSGFPLRKRSGRKDWGSSYISGFLLICLNDILKELSQLRLGGGKRKVQTICLPLRENPWEYHIQDIGHFQLMYEEPLWRKKVNNYRIMERLGEHS